MKCPICKKIYAFDYSYISHYKDIHAPYDCKLCLKTIHGWVNLKKHCEAFHQIYDLCNKCKKQFINAHAYEQHWSIKHLEFPSNYSRQFNYQSIFNHHTTSKSQEKFVNPIWEELHIDSNTKHISKIRHDTGTEGFIDATHYSLEEREEKVRELHEMERDK